MGRSAIGKGCHLSPAGAAPARGQSAEGQRLWRCHPQERSRPQGWPTLSRAAADGQGSHRLRRGNGDKVRVIEGLGHPFEKRMILPLRI
ncbi:hypothetical protein GW17_00041172 [Ensete ventricosum]|nr:hypothetical protein GW17_00041172 [Ensete ventricosum]